MCLVNESYTLMGKPVLAPFLIPVKHVSTPACINEPFMINGEFYKVTCVSFNSPHGVVFVDDVDCVDVSSLGSLIGSHPLFPLGASIVFVQTIDKDLIKARLWLKDEGEFFSTAEAACVALVASELLQKTDRDAAVLMGTTKFLVKWNISDDNVYWYVES